MTWVFTEQGIAQQAAEKGFRPYTTDGHAAESPQNRDRPAVNPDESAIGHPGELGEQRVMPDETDYAGLDPDDASKAAPGRHPQTGRFRAEIAAQHGLTSDGRLNYQPPLSPVPLTGLMTMSGPEGALASSIAGHQGAAMVQGIGAATAASPGLAGQLGRNMPSGVPGQPPVHVAPTGMNAMFRTSPPRAVGGF